MKRSSQARRTPVAPSPHVGPFFTCTHSPCRLFGSRSGSQRGLPYLVPGSLAYRKPKAGRLYAFMHTAHARIMILLFILYAAPVLYARMPFSSTVCTASPPTSAFDGGRTGGWGLYTSSGPKSPVQDNLKGKFMSVCCHNANVMQGQHRSLDSDRTGGEVHALHEEE